MKRTFTIFCLAILCACTNKYKEIENKTEDYALVPKPVELTTAKGRFPIGSGMSIFASPELQKEAEWFSQGITNLGGKPLQKTESASDADIVLQLDASIAHNEGYGLNVSYDNVRVTGKTATGVFYGLQTLLQLAEENEASTDLTVPAVTIKDHPRFAYRGMMLDVARHYFDVDFVKKYIDLIALHKMNRLHWHLTEDQGWRIEIKKYPKLTEFGAWRNGTIVDHFPGTSNDNTRSGGFYTQEQVKEIVAYAADRHIVVVPEIELPGHSGAAIASYPYLSCFPEEPTFVPNEMISDKSKELQASGTPKIVQESWGVYDDVYCAGKEETFKFLQDVFDEIIPLFPSEYIHIGGDECPKKNWERCPLCQKRMKEEGLADEHELQSYFVTRMERYLNSKGKQIIGWDEILEGGLAPNATVMSWRGEAGGIEASRQKHDVIMTPNSYVYFDYYQAKDTENEPLAIGGFLPLSHVYSYEPLSNELTKEEQKYILGAQANLWTEYIATPDYAEYMTLPRMTALSEVVWSPKEHKNWDDFKTRLPFMIEMLQDKGYNVSTEHINEPPKK
ncbi:beta-N-acetylhexosaminidase [Euzebyella saccharophila]|uniref:beta-N-acetylhexosaminidase n=1 Tax=Euzebyella saccharophila TaxID=679664 RepID=A0ABV8JRL5_9FLAO|nr:beta-N-acetylhexosaminidase [Euzebyella saccharophila]